MINSILQDYPWEDVEFYTAWLTQTYYYVRRSTRLLARAASRCPLTEQGDSLHERMLTHLQEERGHELLALRDLREMGRELGEERGETVRLYLCGEGSVYEFLGYVYALETTAVRCAYVLCERMSSAGYPTRFLGVHAAEDPAHVQELDSLMMDWNSSQRRLFADTYYLTRGAYLKMLAACEKIATAATAEL